MYKAHLRSWLGYANPTVWTCITSWLIPWGPCLFIPRIRQGKTKWHNLSHNLNDDPKHTYVGESKRPLGWSSRNTPNWTDPQVWVNTASTPAIVCQSPTPKSWKENWTGIDAKSRRPSTYASDALLWTGTRATSYRWSTTDHSANVWAISNLANLVMLCYVIN